MSVFQRSAYSPEKFVQSSRPPWFTPGVQQDCSEFLRYLLNTVHEQEMNSYQQMSPRSASSGKSEENKAATSLPGLFAQSDVTLDESRPSPSIVERSFAGLLSMTCRCLQCGTISSRTESFMDLALAIPTECQASQPAPSAAASSHSTPAMVGGAPHVSSSDDLQPKSSSSSVVGSLSLTSLLQHFLTTEMLEGDNQYHCDGPCNSLQDGERHVEICSAPTYLIITLMRFSYDPQTGSHSKIFTNVQYPLTLTIPVQSVAPESGFNQEAYGLVGVIVHSGSSSDAGHYFCYVRHAVKPTSTTSIEGTDVESEPDCFADWWFLFNDSRVTRASWENICSLSQKFSRDTAYVLIYHHIDTVAATSTDVSVVTDAFALDPPLHRYLCDMIDEDNRLYFQVFLTVIVKVICSGQCIKLLNLCMICDNLDQLSVVLTRKQVRAPSRSRNPLRLAGACLQLATDYFTATTTMKYIVMLSLVTYIHKIFLKWPK